MPVSTGVPYELSPNEIAGLVPEGSRGKLFESREIAECIWIKGAPMRAKPRCGHGMSFSKKQEGQAADCFFEAAGSCNPVTVSPSAADQPCDCCVPVLYRIGRVLAIVPATIAHAAALPAFGHAELGWDASGPNRSNNLRAVQVGMVAALLTAGNAK